MVKHVILWKLKDDVADKAAVRRGIKEGLEGLKGQIPGLVDITVRIEGLASSNAVQRRRAVGFPMAWIARRGFGRLLMYT